MKHIAIIIGICLTAFSLSAQDQIILRDGDVIDAIVEKIGIDEIEYYKVSNPDGPIYTVAKKDVLSIRFEDGSIEKFEVEEEPEEPAPTVVPSNTTSTTTTTTQPTSSDGGSKKSNIPYNNTFRLGYSHFILKSPGSPGKGVANTLAMSFESRKNNRVGVRYPFYLTFANGFYSFAAGTNVKVYVNDHKIIRGFIGPEFTIGYVNGGFMEGTVVGDFGIDINPIPRLNISFHPSIGYYVLTDFSSSGDAMIIRINTTVGVNF